MPDIVLTVRAQNLAAQQFQRLEQDLQRTNSALRGTGQAASNANPAINRLRNEYRLLSTDVSNVAAVTRQFATTFNSQLQGTIDAALNFERLTKSLQTVSGSTQEANDQLERLVEVARLPGLSLEGAIRASVQLQAIGTAGEEAANVITQFGNALALGGGSSRDLNQITNAIRQMSAEGKILQEDLSIMTTRVAVLVPILQDAFGGTRAEDIRAAGLSAEEFISFVTDALAELPRAGDTAANAIENLSDTSERLQARIGTHLLPAVKDFVGTTESLLGTLLNADPAIQKVIAIAGVLGTTFLTVTAGAAGLTAALPALGAALTFLTANPIGIAITAIAAITAGIVAWKVATADTQTATEQLSASLANQDYSTAITGIEGVRDRITEIRAEIDAINQTDEEGRGFFGSIFEGITQAGARERAALLGEERESEQAIEQANQAILEDLSTAVNELNSQTFLQERSVITRPSDAQPEPEASEREEALRRTLTARREELVGELDESDRAVIDAAVQAALQRDDQSRIDAQRTAEAQERSEQQAREGTGVERLPEFELTVSGQLSETDVENINSAVESLSMLGENQEVPQVLLDLNTAMTEADTAFRATTESTKGLNPFLFEAEEATGRLGTEVGNLAIEVPEAATTIANLNQELSNLTTDAATLGTPDLFDLQTELGPLATQAELPDFESPLRTLDELTESIQTFNATRTGAAEAGLPVIGAEAVLDPDVFAGAFNVSSLVDDIETEFSDIGGEFGASVVQGLIEQRGTIEELFSSFATAAFQDLAVLAGGNLGSQLQSAIAGQLTQTLGVSAAALGPLAAGLAATFAAPALLQSLFGGEGLTQEQIDAQIAAGGAGGLGVGAGLGQFALGQPEQGTDTAALFAEAQRLIAADPNLGYLDALEQATENLESATEGLDLGLANLNVDLSGLVGTNLPDSIAGAVTAGFEMASEADIAAFQQTIIDVFTDADLYSNTTALEIEARNRDLFVRGGVTEPDAQNVEAVQQGLLEVFEAERASFAGFGRQELDAAEFGAAFGLVESPAPEPLPELTNLDRFLEGVVSGDFEGAASGASQLIDSIEDIGTEATLAFEQARFAFEQLQNELIERLQTGGVTDESNLQNLSIQAAQALLDNFSRTGGFDGQDETIQGLVIAADETAFALSAVQQELRDARLEVDELGVATSPFPEAGEIFTGLAPADLDQVALNVSALLAGTFGDQVVTITPEGEALPVMIQNETLSVMLQEQTLKVEVTNKPDVAIPDGVSVTAGSPLPVMINGTPSVTVDGAVQVTGTVNLGDGVVIPVQIENVSDLITQIDDTRATSPAGDFVV